MTTLSQGAAGQRLPSREVAAAYVAACGGDWSDWEPRWLAAATMAGLPTQSDLVQPDLVQANSPGQQFPGRRRIPFRRRRQVVMAGSLAAATMVIAAALGPLVRRRLSRFAGYRRSASRPTPEAATGLMGDN